MTLNSPKRIKLTLQESLAEIANGKYGKTNLMRLANLHDSDIATVTSWWRTLPETTQHAALQAVSQFEKENPEVSFHELALFIFDYPQSSTEARAAALPLLNVGGHTTLIAPLINLLHPSKEEALRISAAEVLASCMELGVMNAISENDMLRVQRALLVAYRQDSIPLVQAACLVGLGFSTLPELPDLIQSAFESSDVILRNAALIAMGHSGDIGAWEDAVLDALESTEPSTLSAAIEASGGLGMDSALAHLNTLLHATSNLDMIDSITWAMSEIGSEQARRYLVEFQALHESDEEISQLVEDALLNLDLLMGKVDFSMPGFDNPTLFGLN